MKLPPPETIEKMTTTELLIVLNWMTVDAWIDGDNLRVALYTRVTKELEGIIEAATLKGAAS